MPTPQLHASHDRTTAERLSSAFNRCFATPEAEPDLLAPDVFFDVHPPFRRFQIQGPDDFTAQLRAVAGGRSSSRPLSHHPGADHE